MATLMKFFPGFFIFIFVAYILSKNRENEANKKLAMFFSGIAMTAFILFLPQLLDGTIADSFLFITSRLDEGVGLDAIGAVAGYAALFVYVLALVVSAVFALRIKKNCDERSSDRLLFDALLVTTAAMFLFPPLPQYVLLLFPFVIFAMRHDRRYMIPCCLLMIGTSVYALAGGPTDLVATAAYTGLLDMGSLMGIIGSYTGPFMGTSMMQLIGFIGAAVQYAGILWIMWVRFGENIKKLLHMHPEREGAGDHKT
jgi:vacuolar-type H+-ATPase subunit I/STV1